jgi:ABC-type nitrate/sulfonate/bicarbonate transport system ATPase subunit
VSAANATEGIVNDGSGETSPNKQPKLELQEVTVEFADDGGRHPVVDRISLSVDSGEFVALIGPSGCGKSTLLNVIAGLVEPANGTVLLDGDIAQVRTGRIAYMHQRDLLMPWRTVLANARLGLEVRGVPRPEADRRAAELARIFGLGDALNLYPWQLSGGMRQRVALLRSSLPDSGVLLLDEPFGALDAITRADLQRWLSEVLDRSDRATVLVTHDVEEALLLADRVLVMSPGPGRIIGEERIDLPRPHPKAVTTSPGFVSLKAQIFELLARRTGEVGI